MSGITGFLDSKQHLIAFPAKRKMKIEALIYLAGKFELQREYTETEINDILNEWHTFGDPATLRRELCDYHFLSRDRQGTAYSAAPVEPLAQELRVKYSK